MQDNLMLRISIDQFLLNNYLITFNVGRVLFSNYILTKNLILITFQHMDNLLHSKPYISPLTTVSSTGKKTEAQSECSTSSAENLENEKPIMHSKLIALYIIRINILISNILYM